MKKNLFIILFSLIISAFAHSQVKLSDEFSFELGKPYTVIDADEKYYYQIDNYIITVKITNTEMTVQKFDASTLSFVKKLEVTDLPKGFGWEAITVYNNKFLLFYNSYDKPNVTEQLYYRELDLENMTFGSDNLLCSVKGKITGTLFGKGFSFNTRDKFNFNYSYDSSKVLLQYRRKPVETDDAINHDSIGFFVYDKNFTLLWTKDVKMPYTEKKMSILEYSVDSEGNVYILTAVSDGSVDIGKCMNGKSGYHIELLRIFATSKEIDKVTVTLKSKYINSISLFESPKNYMVCAGFYAKTKDKYNADGLFMFKVGKSGDAYDTASYEIPVEILNQYVSEKTQNKNEKKESDDKAEFEDLVMRNVLICDDGSFILVGEQYYSVTTTTTDSKGSVSSHTNYYYNDILAAKIGTDGKLAWMKKLPKRQKGAKGRGGLGFKYINEKGNHYFLFLDNIKNQDIAISQIPACHIDEAGGFLTAYKINDADGEVTKHTILDTRDAKGMDLFQFNTGRIMPVSTNEFVVEFYKKDKQDILVRITIK
jgi:hypothetical protein